MMRYTPTLWYWLRDDGAVYSAPAQSVVTGDDDGYKAFLEGGNVATRWPDEADLGGQTDAALLSVIGVYGLAVSPKASLTLYANTKQWALVSSGYTATIATGVEKVFATDPVSQSLIIGKSVRFMQPGAPSSTQWQFADGFATISAATFMSCATKMADFVQATFDTLQTVLAGIASNSITTTEQVDAAAWPANHD